MTLDEKKITEQIQQVRREMGEEMFKQINEIKQMVEINNSLKSIDASLKGIKESIDAAAAGSKPKPLAPEITEKITRVSHSHLNSNT